MSDLVDNTALREAVAREMARPGGPTLATICRRLGWMRVLHDARRKDDYQGVDTTRLQRRLGRAPQTMGNGEKAKSTRVNYDIAVRICEAAGIDPVDVGL